MKKIIDNIKNTKIKDNLLIILSSFFTLLFFIYFNNSIFSLETLKEFNKIIMKYGIYYLLLFIILFFFYRKTILLKENKRLKIITIIGSIIYSILLILLNSFYLTNDIVLIGFSKTAFLLSMIKFIGVYFFIRNILKVFFIKLNEIKIKDNNSKNTNFLIMVGMLFIFYLPYIIVFYPGTMNMDSLFEINQFYGIIPWTQHHPVLPTIIYGLFMKIGRHLVNDNFGLFLSNILQVIISCFIVCYGINTMYKITKNKTVRNVLFLIFALFPIWPINFYTCVKDVWFSIFFLLFMIETIKLYYYKKLSILDWILYILSAILFILFRNNGIHIIILSIPFIVLLLDKKQRINFLKCIILSLLISICFNKIITSVYNIEKGSIREALSLPLQQTSRYVVSHDLTKKEERIINKVIEIDDIKDNYNPETVDYVKIHFKDDVSKKDLIKYFKVWFMMFFKHPKSYLYATINSTYGYFYPDKIEFKDGVAELTINDTGINKMNLNLHLNNRFSNIRNRVIDHIYDLRYMPIIGLLFNCGLYSFILILDTLVLIYYKRKEILLLVPLYLVLLVCILSPVNALVRYVMPLMIVIPFMQPWILKIIKQKNNNV